MNLKVKSELLSKYFITKFALNLKYNILVIFVDNTKTTTFFHLPPQQPPLEIFQGQSKPTGKKSSLAWNHDGTFLALGSNSLELWKFDGKKMIAAKNYQEDFIDIKIVAWSPDCHTIAYGGISKKNTIKIKNISTGSTRDLVIPLTVCGISFDPFGKYLIVLLRNNVVIAYNSNDLTKMREVMLSPQASSKNNLFTVREIRTMSWSPDFNNLVCPSLDDSKVSLALNLCRSSGFKVGQAFLGHVSSISCAKFNPNLY